MTSVATLGGSGADTVTSGGSGQECVAHTNKMATTITGSAADGGRTAGLQSAEATMDISSGSLTLEISLPRPEALFVGSGMVRHGWRLMVGVAQL